MTLGPKTLFRHWVPGRRCLALAMAGALFVPSAIGPAFAFKIFGLKFFEPGDEETEVVPDAQPYTLDFKVTGADKDLDKAIRNASVLARDEKRPPPGTPGLIARAKGDYGRILTALYSTGRYGGTIHILVGGQPVENLRPDVALPDPVAVSVAVDPGPLFSFGEIHVDGLPNEAITREDRRALDLKHWDFKVGAEARSGRILDTEGRLVEVWRQRGHPKAEVTTRDIVADHRTNTVDVMLVVTPGPAARLGPVDVTGTERMDEDFVRWMTGIKPGEPYDPDTIKRARDRLQHLGVFSSVSVVEASQVGPDGVLPLTFKISERKRRVIGGGGSYSTTDGAALEAYWMHRNLFGHAESLRFDASVSQIGAQEVGDLTYNLATTFRRPGVFTPDTDFTLQIAGTREVVEDAYDSVTVGAKAGFDHRFTENLTASAALNVERDWVEDAFGDHDYMIVSLPSTLDYDGRDNKLEPTEGIHATLEAEPLFEFERSTVALIAQGSLASYLSFGERDRMILAGRAALGSIVGGSLEDIPADRRFFLGGGGSIRGYEYRTVGPRFDDQVVGGMSFWEASMEFRVRVTDTIGFVPFIDAGAAYEDSVPDFSEDVRVGAGMGLRYYTPLGPIRLDVATPLNPDDGAPAVAFYVGLGQAF